MEDNGNPNGGAKSPETQKKRNGFNWVIAVILLLAGFIGGYFIWGAGLKNAKANAKAQTEIAAKTKMALMAEEEKTASLINQKLGLEADIAVLKARPTTIVRGGGSDATALAAKDKHIASLEKTLAQCMSSKNSTSGSGAGSSGTSGIGIGTGSGNNTGVAEPAFDQPNLTSKKTQTVKTGLPEEYYDSDGSVPCCIRLGGNSNRHIPHIGMRDFDFADAKSNGIGGFNWYLKGTTADLTGDYGCTHDGTFFISAKLVEKYLIKADGGKIELIAKAFDWVPRQMEKFGDYYICSGK